MSLVDVIRVFNKLKSSRKLKDYAILRRFDNNGALKKRLDEVAK